MARIVGNLLIICTVPVLLNCITIEIIHDGNLRGKLGPIDEKNDRVCYEDDTNCAGGFGRLVTAVKELRSKESDDKIVLYLNTGGTCGRTAMFEILEPAKREELCIKVLQMLSPDAIAVSYLELEDGVTAFKHVAAKANVSFVSSIKFQEISDCFSYYKIINRGPVTIAVMGFMYVLRRKLLPLLYERFIPHAYYHFKTMAGEIQKHKPHVVIALSDAPFEEYEPEVNFFSGVDILLSTDGRPKPFWKMRVDADILRFHQHVNRWDTRRLYMAQTLGSGLAAGRLTCRLNGKLKMVACEGRQLQLTRAMPEDQQARRLYEDALAAVAPSRQLVIGHTAVDLIGTTCYWEECNLGNLVADAYVQCVAHTYEGEGFTDVPLSIVSSGSIIRSISPQGENITMFDLMDAYKPRGNITVIRLTEKDLSESLEIGISQAEAGQNGFLQISGLQMHYKTDAGLGERIQKLRAGCRFCDAIKIDHIKKEHRYSVVTNYLQSEGIDGHFVMRSSILTRKALGISDKDCVQMYMQKGGTILTGMDGRIIRMPKYDTDNNKQSYSTISCNMLLFIVICINICLQL